MTLRGKWALVTGAAAGLGFAVAESLASAGAHIVLHDIRAPEAAAGRIRDRFHVETLAIAADLTKRQSIEALTQNLLNRLGTIDILVNNAVVRHFAPVEQFPPEKWEEALAVNLSAPFHLIRLLLPSMRRNGWGRIVNMASIYSSRATVDRIDYVTTKTAIIGMTRAVALETAGSGITCNAISPGTLPTPAIETKIAAIAERDSRSVADATRDYLSARQPSGEFIAMENVGAMVVFLAGPSGKDITGAALPIDGGWSAI